MALNARRRCGRHPRQPRRFAGVAQIAQLMNSSTIKSVEHVSDHGRTVLSISPSRYRRICRCLHRDDLESLARRRRRQPLVEANELQVRGVMPTHHERGRKLKRIRRTQTMQAQQSHRLLA